MKVCLYGGTFNPIHNGHIQIAQLVMKKYNFDKIIFIPAKIPPHKMDVSIAPANLRYEMVKLAIEKYKYFEVSDFELKKKKITYTISTIKHFLQKHDKLAIMIGSDEAIMFKSWKNYDRILKLVPVIVIMRLNYPKEKIPSDIRDCFEIPKFPLIDISSSVIRRKLEEGEKVDKYLSTKVIEFIRKKGLYT